MLFSILIASCGSKKEKEESQLTESEEVFSSYANESITISDFIEKQPEIIELTETVSLPKEAIVNLGDNNVASSLDKQENSDYWYCVNNGSPRNANYLLEGNGKTLYVRFAEANWNGIKNTCGNYRSSDRRFEFPDSRMYQYQMVLFEMAPGATNYFLDICKENMTYSVKTKKGFKYYIHTNDEKYEDNRGYTSFCYGLN